MRISIANQPEIERLSMALKQSLATMAAAIQTGWNQQHDGDGGHGDITATSISTGNFTALAKVRLNGVATFAQTLVPTMRIDNVTTAGITTANVLKIQLIVNLVTLTGIDATGRQPGDLLLLINDSQTIASPVDLLISAADTNSLAPNRFIGGVASGFPITLNESRGVWLMYDVFTLTGTTPFFGWRVISP